MSAPRTAKEYAERSAAHVRAGDYDAALADAAEAVRLDPKLAAGYVARAEAHLRKRADYEALADATKAVQLDPLCAAGRAISRTA